MWLYIPVSIRYTKELLLNSVFFSGCFSEEVGKVLEICIPCWICTRCDLLQKKFRSLFHGVSNDRCNEELNTALLSISNQLGQERCHFRIGGLITVNHDMLGKVSKVGVYIVKLFTLTISFTFNSFFSEL